MSACKGKATGNKGLEDGVEVDGGVKEKPLETRGLKMGLSWMRVYKGKVTQNGKRLVGIKWETVED